MALHGNQSGQNANMLCPIEDRQALGHVDPPPPYSSVSSTWDPALLLDPQRHVLPSVFAPHAQPAPTSAPSSVNDSPHLGGVEGPALAFHHNANSLPVIANGYTAGPAPSEVMFQFMGPATDDGYLSSGDQVSTDFVNGGGPGSSGANGAPTYIGSEGALHTPPNGMASMIERNFHVQDRQDVPEPKRRKIVPGMLMDAKPAFQSGSNGILAQGVRLEGEQAKAAPPDGTATPSKQPITVDLTEGMFS